MAWSDLEEVEHLPRRGLLRDGRLVLVPARARRRARAARPAGRRHAGHRAADGAPFAVPLGLTTRVLGGRRDADRRPLAAARRRACAVVEVGAERRRGARASRSWLDRAEATPTSRRRCPTRAPATTTPRRRRRQPDPEPAARRRPARCAPSLEPPERLVQLDGHRWEPIPAVPTATTTFVIDDLADVPAVEPVIGPQLRSARDRLRLSIDQLADRTRIRPHVIEAIEIDDFAPCGGDFYARGHLRTLARVLGLDVAPLLATYDERYADAPIDPRRVFEAELATGRRGPIRGTRGGPNWSVMVAAVMAVVLAWSIARLVMDSPAAVPPSSPSLADGRPAWPAAASARRRSRGAHRCRRWRARRGPRRHRQGRVHGSLAFGQTRRSRSRRRSGSRPPTARSRSAWTARTTARSARPASRAGRVHRALTDRMHSRCGSRQTRLG